MKKTISLIAMIVAFSIPSFAQSGGGLKAGLSVSNLKVTSDGFGFDFSSRIGFHGGLYYHFFLGEHFAIQPELLYSLKGAKLSVMGFEANTNLDYIDIPLLARYQVTDLINLHAGPQVGLLIAANSVVDGEKEDIKEELTTLDFGLAFGGGVDLPMGLNFTVRYVLGLSNIAADVEDDSTLKNNVFQFSIGYKLFGKK